MGDCEHCGLLIDNDCFVSGVRIQPENRKLYGGCAYFIERVFEDGKALDAELLLLLAENEIRRKR